MASPKLASQLPCFITYQFPASSVSHKLEFRAWCSKFLAAPSLALNQCAGGGVAACLLLRKRFSLFFSIRPAIVSLFSLFPLQEKLQPAFISLKEERIHMYSTVRPFLSWCFSQPIFPMHNHQVSSALRKRNDVSLRRIDEVRGSFSFQRIALSSMHREPVTAGLYHVILLHLLSFRLEREWNG